jgi:hypothetical protein
MTERERIADMLAEAIAEEEAAIGRGRPWRLLHAISKSVRRGVADRVLERLAAAGVVIVPPDDGR